MRNITAVVRVVLPLLAAVVVLWTGYVATTQRRYTAANAFSSELVAGESIGQTFIAHYDDLSSVDIRVGTAGHQTDPTRNTLVLHLRADPTATTDLATATIPPSQVLTQDPWYTVSFPPIAGSQYKSYYLLIESPGGVAGKGMAILWYQPVLRGDPYANGAAYQNGEKTKGDLAFGLGYSAAPIEVWTTMLADAGANTSPVLLYALLLFALLAIIWAVAHPYLSARIVSLRRRWKAWSLASVLLVGLIYGLLFVVITPPMQGPDEYAHFAYVALLDKHNLDDTEVQALDLAGKDRDMALIKAVNASADRNDFTRRLLRNDAPGAPTRTDAFLFQQVRQPATYYWLCALALRAARALGVADDPYTQPEAAIYIMRLVSLVLGLLVIFLAWLFCMLLLPTKASQAQDDEQAPKIPACAMLLAMLPMHVFVATSINNDILAELAVSALFVSMAALYVTSFGALAKQLDPNRRGKEALLIVLCILLAIAGLATKATASAASFPLLVAGLLLWAAYKLYLRRRSVQSVSRPFPNRLKPVVIALAAILLVIGAFVVVCGPDNDHANGWYSSYAPVQRVSRVESPGAHDGAHVIQLNTSTSGSAIQKLIPQLIFHPDLRITFAGWARIAPQQDEATGVYTAQLAIQDGVQQAGIITSTLPSNGDWTRLELTADVGQNAEQVLLRINALGTGKSANIQFDDLSLRVEGVTQPWNDTIYKPALLDPSGENAPWTVRPLFATFIPADVRDMVDALLNPQPFSKPALWLTYAQVQYNSFWGSFGWLSIDLPPFFYLAIGVVLVLALLGLLMRVLRPGPMAQVTRWPVLLALVSVFALAVAIVASFVKQMALTAYGGLPSNPQGRYLFVLAIPVAWLIISGLDTLINTLPSKAISKASSFARYIAATALVFFAAYCLFALIVPYYYG